MGYMRGFCEVGIVRARDNTVIAVAQELDRSLLLGPAGERRGGTARCTYFSNFTWARNHFRPKLKQKEKETKNKTKKRNAVR